MVHVQPGIDEKMIRPPFITTATDSNETRSHQQLTHIDMNDNGPAQSAPTSREAAKDACGDEWRPNPDDITCTPSNANQRRLLDRISGEFKGREAEKEAGRSSMLRGAYPRSAARRRRAGRRGRRWTGPAPAGSFLCEIHELGPCEH